MSDTSKRYFIINKPYNMVSQFISSHNVPLLGSLNFSFPEGTHAIGRLDSTSEGLLILTTDKTVTRKLFLAQQPHSRSYLVSNVSIFKNCARWKRANYLLARLIRFA